MALSVVMPALEMAQETGKLVSWLKKEGDQVRKGEMLLEIETDKAVVEIEALGDGILAGITAKVGDIVPVGRTIAWLVQAGEAVPAAASAPTQTGRRTDAAPAAAAAAIEPPGTTASGGPRISPKARKLAKEHGVDISTLKGSGLGGEVLADDVLKASEMSRLKPAPTPEPVGTGFSRLGSTVLPVGTIGRIMAERTTQSWTTVPHFFVTREVDATALNAAREKVIPGIEKSHGVKVTHTDLLVAAVAHALRRQPRLNSSWGTDGIVVNEEINIAVAMAVEATDLAVVTGVIHRTDTLPLGEIALQRRDLAGRAREGRLHAADIAGATFTISNLGMVNVDAFTAIIVPPQAAILAVGAITDRVVAVNGQVAIRPMMTLTLSCDHRVVDGMRAALFMNLVVEAILHASDLS